MPNLGTGASRDHQRHDTHDECEGGHEDRPQSHPGRFQHGGDGVVTLLLLEVLRELHDENCVLTGEADQHDEANLREDVVVAVIEQHANDRGQQAHRHDQDDGQR